MLGEAFDGDPFLLFELRGRTRQQVLADIRRARDGAGAPAVETTDPLFSAAVETVPFTVGSEADYERACGDLAAIRFRLEPPAVHAAIVRGLGPPPGWSLAESLADLLAPAYAAASALARGVAEPEETESPAPSTRA